MCGIAGIINPKGFDLDTLKDSLRHRGPDEQSIYAENNVVLVHTRLAVQDVLLGQQPFHFDDYSIIFNGEIYNHKELRHLLTDFTFKTHSDTETLLYLYIKFGVEMFSLLDGMFAFCIFDRKKQVLFLARDRAGKKPLYYFQQSSSFFFASELNTLKSIVRLDIDREAINCYLRSGFIYQSYTPYKNVHRLSAATYLQIDINTQAIKTTKYYDILQTYTQRKSQLSFQDAVNVLDEKLQKSVEDRMLSSDVEVGAFLSSGIDSNLIVALASRRNKNLKTFTVKFDGLYDESILAKLAAQKYQTQHTELQVSIDLDNDIELILSRYGEPFMDSSAVPSFYVSREAKKHVSVVLNGDGADELFAGYRRYVPAANHILRFLRYAAPLGRFLPKPNCKQSSYNYFYRLLAMGKKSNLDFYLSATTDIFEDILSFKDGAILKEMNEFVTGIFANRQLSQLSQFLCLDFHLLLFSTLLVKMDIATMANSLEARSPFLSKHMLDFAPSLPDNYKVNNLVTKSILRELAKKYLPIELVSQPKRGFEAPLKKWVNMDLKEKINDSLLPGCYSENYVDRSFISKILANKENVAEEKRAKILWNLFCLEVWHASEAFYG